MPSNCSTAPVYVSTAVGIITSTGSRTHLVTVDTSLHSYPMHS